MCDPISLALIAGGTALSGAGGALNNKQARANNKASRVADWQEYQQDIAVAKKRNETLNRYTDEALAATGANMGDITGSVNDIYGLGKQDARRTEAEAKRG